jgi:hypothetical protein
VARTTVVNQLHQNRLDPSQIRELATHIPKLLLGEHARFITVSAVIEPQQPGHFFEAKAQPLRGLYEFHPGDIGGWGAMELKTNVSRIRVRFTRQRLRINEL